MRIVVDSIKEAWKLGSIKLAAVAGVLAAIMASNQTIALGLVYFLPDGPLRVLVAVLIGVVVFVIPTATRLLGKEKKDEA
jgi:hypothetical protein